MGMNPLEEIAQTAWDALQGRLASTIVEGLRGLVDGAEEDLRTFGLYIATDLVNAIRRNDAAWEAEVRAQARVLLEVSRLRAVNANHAILMQVLHALVRTGLEVATALVKGLVSGAVEEAADQT